MSKTTTPRTGWLTLLATLALTTPAIAQTTASDAGRPSAHPSRHTVHAPRAEGDTASTRAGQSQGEKGVIPGAGTVSASRTNAQSDGPFKIERRSAGAPSSRQSPQPASTPSAKDSPAVNVPEQTRRATSGVEGGMPNRISMNVTSQRQSAPPKPEAPSLTIKTKSVPQ